MRKWTAVFLAVLMLLSMSASAKGTAAEASEDMMPNLGEVSQLPNLQNHYNMALGYMITYDASEFICELRYGRDVLVLAEDESANMLISGTEIRAEGIDSLLNEAVGGYGSDAVIGEPTQKLIEGELHGHSGVMVRSIDVQTEGIVNRFYLVYKPVEKAETETVVDVLCITATFPADKSEEYGIKFDTLVEGIVLNIPEAQYCGEGWTLWYPSDIIEPQEIYGKDGFVSVDKEKSDVSMIVTLSDAAPELAPDLLDEAAAGFGAETKPEQTEWVSGGRMVVRSIEVEGEGMTTRFYAAWSYDTLNDDVYCMTASFPTADAALYGAAFDRMADSFALNAENAD